MLYRIMSRLFANNELYGRYTPRPYHLLFALFLIAVGSATIGYDWTLFGICSIVSGIAMGVTIILGMNWDKMIEYWNEIARVLEAAAKIKDPVTRATMLQSMGYNVTPETITIIETEKETKEHGWTQRIQKIPVSPATMQVIADKVLASGNASFAETKYGTIIPNFRKVQKELKGQKLIIKTKSGHVFNKRGIDTLFEYASEGVKLDIERRRKDERG